jgi:hypothetical protein
LPIQTAICFKQLEIYKEGLRYSPKIAAPGLPIQALLAATLAVSANNAHSQINAHVDTVPSLGRPASFGY